MTVPLPTQTDYAAAIAALVAAQEAVETITWQLRENVAAADSQEAPSAEDLLALFGLVDEVDRQRSDLHAKRDELEKSLRLLYLVRRELAAAA